MSVKEEETSITLSAIIPVGGFPNGDSVLKSWVQNQLPHGLEVIMVLDSDDESVRDSVHEILHSNPEQIRLEISQNRNPGSTREIGLTASKGKWVCFWDADDLPEVSTIWKNVTNIENQKVDIIVGHYRIVNSETNNPEDFYPVIHDHLTSLYINPGLWRFVFKRKLLEGVSFPALRMGEDQVFVFRSITRSESMIFVKDTFYNYYQYPSGQLTKVKGILGDLVKSRDLCMEEYLLTKESYILIALYRQDFTLVKRGNWLIKIKSICHLVLLAGESISNLRIFFKTIKLVLNEK